MGRGFRLAVGLAVLPVFTAQLACAEELSGYSGAQLYQRFCASCHGARAEGNGPVAAFFKVAPPDLTQLARRSGGEFPAERVRKSIDGRSNLPPHGTRTMPVWGLEFTAAAGNTEQAREHTATLIDRLVDYVRSIQLP